MGTSSQPYRNTPRVFGDELENATARTADSDGHYLLQQPSPGRDWSPTTAEYRWLWDLHVCGVASLFSVLAVFCLFTVLKLRAQLSHSRNVTSLNVFLGLLASARLLVLFLDPYGSRLILPLVMLQVLWDLGYPCLVSAFSLLQLAVTRETEVKMIRLSESTASIVITFHFCLIITAGVLVAVQNWLRLVWLVTQIVFIVWGSFLFLTTLLGCLRGLRSIVKVPLRFLTQVDPGCEVNNIVPLGMFTERSPREHQQRRQHHPRHQHHPGIHITDVDDQTYSYASEGSPVHPELHRSESLPLRILPSMSPTRINPPDRKSKSTSPHEDPQAVKPLIDKPRRFTITEKVGHPARGPATIFTFEPPSPNRSLSPSTMPSIFAEDIKNEARKVKHPGRSRVERHLQHLVFTSSLGILLCLLRAYDIGSLDGLLVFNSAGRFMTWFWFQTTSRIIELLMAYVMVCGSQQSMNSRYYYYRNWVSHAP